MTDAVAWRGESMLAKAICSMAVLREETGLSEEAEKRGGGTGSGHAPL